MTRPMTCLTMLDRMLEAELDELGGRGDSALARHLRECARCRAVAKQITRSTSDLAEAVQESRPSLRKAQPGWRVTGHRAGRLIALGLAASATFVALRAWRVSGTSADRLPNATYAAIASSNGSSANRLEQRGRESQSSGVSRAMPTLRRPVVVVRRVKASRVPAATALAVRAVPVASERITPAPSVEPVRVDETPVPAPLGNEVRADPPAGKRATIIRTPTPNVTVVWLSESTSTSPGTQP